jgi:hypothetical protein
LIGGTHWETAIAPAGFAKHKTTSHAQSSACAASGDNPRTATASNLTPVIVCLFCLTYLAFEYILQKKKTKCDFV